MAKSTGCGANQISVSMSTQDQLSPAFDRRILPPQFKSHCKPICTYSNHWACLQAARTETDIQLESTL